MNILMLSDFWPTSSNPISGVFVQEQVEEYQRQGHQVTVIAPLPKLRGRQRPRVLNHAGAVVHSPTVLIPPGLSYLRPASRVYVFNVCLSHWASTTSRVLADRFDVDKMDAVHINGLSFAGLAAPRIRGLETKKMIVTVHGEDPLTLAMAPTSKFQGIVARACRRIDLIALCGTPLRGYAESLGIPEEKTRIVPNGTFIPQSIASRIAGRVPSVISIANLEDHKNIAANIHALAKLRERHEFTYTVIGDGSQRSELERLAFANGLSDKVRFTGRLDHETTMALLATADVFCLPSLRDAFGIVFIEAMARRLPVIGGLGTGAEDIIEDAADGFLVNPRDAGEIAQALSKLLVDPALRRKMGDRAYEKAKGYSWKRNVEAYVELFGARSAENRKTGVRRKNHT